MTNEIVPVNAQNNLLSLSNLQCPYQRAVEDPGVAITKIILSHIVSGIGDNLKFSNKKLIPYCYSSCSCCCCCCCCCRCWGDSLRKSLRLRRFKSHPDEIFPQVNQQGFLMTYTFKMAAMTSVAGFACDVIGSL